MTQKSSVTLIKFKFIVRHKKNGPSYWVIIENAIQVNIRDFAFGGLVVMESQSSV